MSAQRPSRIAHPVGIVASKGNLLKLKTTPLGFSPQFLNHSGSLHKL